MRHKAYTFALLSVFCLGCDQWFPREEPDPAEPSRLEQLKDMHNYSLSALKNSWPSRTDCDATLWAGLACVAGSGLDLTEAEEAPGKWRRRPAPHCKVPDESRSTISNDMLLGVMSCAHSRGDLALLERLAHWGEVNNWQMGDPRGAVGEVWLKPINQGYLGRAIKSLGGPVKSYSRIAPGYAKPDADYVYHVQTVGILLDIQATGGATEPQITRLRANSEENPSDCLLMSARALYDDLSASAADCWLSPAWSPPSYVRSGSGDDEAYINTHKAYGLSILINHMEGG